MDNLWKGEYKSYPIDHIIDDRIEELNNKLKHCGVQGIIIIPPGLFLNVQIDGKYVAICHSHDTKFCLQLFDMECDTEHHMHRRNFKIPCSTNYIDHNDVEKILNFLRESGSTVHGG